MSKRFVKDGTIQKLLEYNRRANRGEDVLQRVATYSDEKARGYIKGWEVAYRNQGKELL